MKKNIFIKSLVFLMGFYSCNLPPPPPGMHDTSNTLEYILQMEVGWIKFILLTMLVLSVFFVIIIIKALIKTVLWSWDKIVDFLHNQITKKIWSKKFSIAFWVGIFYFFGGFFAEKLDDATSYWEQHYKNRTKESEPTLADDIRYQAYIKKLSLHTSDWERSVILEGLDSLSRQIGGKPVDYLMAMNLECSLNPYELHVDRETGQITAASILQFTETGMTEVPGYTMKDIVFACKNRNIKLLVKCYITYMVKQWEIRNRPNMNDGRTIYMIVFCPAAAGKSEDKVLYSMHRESKLEKRYYTKNQGLDGWYTDSKGLILHSKSAKDGNITSREAFLCIKYKEKEVVNKFK